MIVQPCQTDLAARASQVDRPCSRYLCSYRYYFHSNYAYTWGGGHDFQCDNSFTSCYANVHHDYNSNGRGYHTTASNAYLSGQYSWNFPSEGANSIYEVFVQL